jgi:hypothetical protein
VHRTLCALATSVTLVVALNVGAAAAGNSHSSPKPHGHGSIHGSQDNQTGVDPSAHGTLQFGPFASGSPDSGTCGNNWADDTYNRFFTVVTNEDGTSRVVEFFKDATFVTAVLPAGGAGPISSPGACENGATTHAVKAGIQGRFQGYFLISVSAGTLKRDAVCTLATCGTTADFVKTVFGATATYDVTTFLFNYSSSDQQLIQRHWKNASEDRGGNLGDIRTS